MLGWIVNNIWTTYANSKAKRLDAATRFIERQLEELYGPLFFLIIEGRRTFRDLLDALGRNYVFQEDRHLSPDELKTWLFWVDYDFLPRNEKMKQLLESKTHLLVDAIIPDSYLTFIDHHNSWKVNHCRWQKEGVEYAWHSKINFPKQFEEDVISTFSRLKQKHSLLLAKQA
jgi:hypothetical protein